MIFNYTIETSHIPSESHLFSLEADDFISAYMKANDFVDMLNKKLHEADCDYYSFKIVGLHESSYQLLDNEWANRFVKELVEIEDE